MTWRVGALAAPNYDIAHHVNDETMRTACGRRTTGDGQPAMDTDWFCTFCERALTKKPV